MGKPKRKVGRGLVLLVLPAALRFLGTLFSDMIACLPSPPPATRRYSLAGEEVQVQEHRKARVLLRVSRGYSPAIVQC